MNQDEYRQWRPDVMGWSDDIIPYYETIAKWLPDDAKVIEVGVFRGRSALFLLEELDRLNKQNITFCGVDIEPFPSALKNLNFGFMQMKSCMAANLVADDSLDFVFIDADHSYESVLDDIILWYPKVKSGGIIAGHDYNLAEFEVWSTHEQKTWMMIPHPGVVKAVNEFFGSKEVNHPTTSVWEHIKE